MKDFANLLSGSRALNQVYVPLILRLSNPSDKETLSLLFKEQKIDFVYNEIYGQLQELIKGFHPSRKINDSDYKDLITAHLGGIDIDEYGVWVYYPWSKRLAHLLDENEFTQVRTNRNQYKITKEEHATLSKKKIGIIGLSVGQSISLTLAMERGFGELRLADFDELELSNLNRIRTGVHNLGVPKAVITAREISEIDPYLKVTCFLDGLTRSNMDDFFLKNGKLDILIDECDGLDIKILSRYKARELRIPVLMDTSDRGMLDVERFDLEPDRPVLHGTVEGVNLEGLSDLTNEDKVPIIMKMLGIENVSLKTKASMLEVQQSINTWPQLASSVVLGGAVGADVCRRILLNEFHDSGRYYVDLEEIIANKMAEKVLAFPVNSGNPLSIDDMISITRLYQPSPQESIVRINEETVRDLVKAACSAPSVGNTQPWKWLYNGDKLFLFNDEYRSPVFSDFQKESSHLALGAAYENLALLAEKKGLDTSYQFQPILAHPYLLAVIGFKHVSASNPVLSDLSEAIFKRCTNRTQSQRENISPVILDQLASIAESVHGARLHCYSDSQTLDVLGNIVGVCERIRLLNHMGHYEFMQQEMRWTNEEAELARDGIAITSSGYSGSEIGALTLIKNPKVVAAINKFGGGKAFDALGKAIVNTASTVCVISMPESPSSFFEGGRSMQRFWLAATNLNLAIHPLMSPINLYSRIFYGEGVGLDNRAISELSGLFREFDKIAHYSANRRRVFLASITLNQDEAFRSFRLPLEKVLFFV